MVLIAILLRYFIYNHTWNILCITFSTIGSRLFYCWSNSRKWQMWKKITITFYGGGINWAVIWILIPPHWGQQITQKREQLAAPVVSSPMPCHCLRVNIAIPTDSWGTALFLLYEPHCNSLRFLPMLSVQLLCIF